MVLIGILMSAIFILGCSTIQQAPSATPLPQDPLVGIWVSNQSSSITFYRFWQNGTFEAWSHTGDVPQKYLSRHSGEWEARREHSYYIKGPLMGYGEMPPISAVWRDLILVFDPKNDTFSIPLYQDQVFTRLSRDPDSSV
jgi:hypothetical protein